MTATDISTAIPDTPEKTKAYESAPAKRRRKTDAFGGVGRFRWPFSAQLKDEIRRRFPEDAEVFRKADRAQRKIWGMMVALRLATFFITFVPLVILFSYVLHFAGTGGKEFFFLPLPDDPTRQFAEVALIVFLAIGALWLVRYLLRTLIISAVVFPEIQELSHRVSADYGTIRHDVTKECREARSRPAAGGWPVFAMQHAMRALHDLKRAEYLDRYSTTVFWKLEFGFMEIEYTFWVLKVALFVAVAALAFDGYTLFDSQDAIAIPSGSVVFLSAVFGVAALVGWILWRAKNDFLTEKFSRAINKSEVDPYEEIGKLVRDCTSDIVARDNPNRPHSGG